MLPSTVWRCNCTWCPIKVTSQPFIFSFKGCRLKVELEGKGRNWNWPQDCKPKLTREQTKPRWNNCQSLSLIYVEMLGFCLNRQYKYLNQQHQWWPTSTKGLSLASCSKMLSGVVSRRACRLVAFSADIRGGCGSWMESTGFNTAVLNLLRGLEGGLGVTFSSWQGVWPKLLMMPSRALRSVSLAMASRSTAPADGNGTRHTAVGARKLVSVPGARRKIDLLTLVGAIVEDVQRIDGFFASLLETKDQIDPLVEVTGHVLTLLEFKTNVWVEFYSVTQAIKTNKQTKNTSTILSQSQEIISCP